MKQSIIKVNKLYIYNQYLTIKREEKKQHGRQ